MLICAIQSVNILSDKFDKGSGFSKIWSHIEPTLHILLLCTLLYHYPDERLGCLKLFTYTVLHASLHTCMSTKDLIVGFRIMSNVTMQKLV